jgi:cytosine/adenosine deaminase-related metal-dependent hydrolase
MRFLSADFIFPVHLPPVPNGILIVNSKGKIIDLLIPGLHEIPSSIEVESYNGILCPGFVNAHCHLELSHLRGKFSMKKGLPEFIGEMVTKRNSAEEKILEAMKKADDEMYEGGIVAVGDISNNAISIKVKKKSKLFYHTFIELFDIVPEKSKGKFSEGKIVQQKFSKAGLKSSIVPHAMYTVTLALLKLIVTNARKTRNVLSIHNQETAGENEMFLFGKGKLIKKLQSISPSYIKWNQPNDTSLGILMENLSPEIKLQLVHNTFTELNDIHVALKKSPNLFWCLCPNANLFIENKLPALKDFINEKCDLTIGTDSYASNTSLSVLNEIKTLNKKFPEIGLAKIICWATINGASFLGQSKKLGSFEKGKTPGVNYISEIDLKKLKLKEGSRIQKVI